MSSQKEDRIFRFSYADTRLISAALRVAAQSTQRNDLQAQYQELYEMIHAKLNPKRKAAKHEKNKNR